MSAGPPEDYIHPLAAFFLLVDKMGNPSVLIIDDELNLLSSLLLLIESEFEVFTASNGRVGVELFNNNLISLILLDLDMPIMDGLETLNEIRKKDKNAKVIIMTGRGNYKYAKLCADMNVQGFLEKPVEPEYLIKRIKDVIGIVDYPVLMKHWDEEYDAKKSSMSSLVRNAISFVHKNFNKGITRDDVSDHLGITSDYLCKKLKKECNLSINDYINRYKIHISAEYLKNENNITVEEVSKKVGISDANYFNRLFKKYTGTSPGKFKKEPPSN